jgi:hypothetical protein
MRAAWALLVLLALVGAGCASGDDSPSPTPQPRVDKRPPPDEPAPPRPKASSQERLIQAWLAAVQTRDYKRAASYFSRGALIDQGAPHRLRTRAQAISFNRHLPCTAALTAVRNVHGATLATFLLTDGPGGSCEGSVRVRFTIRDRTFRAFRQLPDAPEGQAVEA